MIYMQHGHAAEAAQAGAAKQLQQYSLGLIVLMMGCEQQRHLMPLAHCGKRFVTRKASRLFCTVVGNVVHRDFACIESHAEGFGPITAMG